MMVLFRILLLSGVAAVVSGGVVYLWADIPVVEFSYTTQRCVGVVPESAGSCGDLPGTYERVWVR